MNTHAIHFFETDPCVWCGERQPRENSHFCSEQCYIASIEYLNRIQPALTVCKRLGFKQEIAVGGMVTLQVPLAMEMFYPRIVQDFTLTTPRTIDDQTLDLFLDDIRAALGTDIVKRGLVLLQGDWAANDLGILTKQYEAIRDWRDNNLRQEYADPDNCFVCPNCHHNYLNGWLAHLDGERLCNACLATGYPF